MPSPEVPLEGQYHPALTAQLRHVQAPAYGEYFPIGQFKHVLTDEAPVAAEYVPAVQVAHALAPASVENVPGMQPEHVSDSAIENVPATQVVHVLAPALARVPA